MGVLLVNKRNRTYNGIKFGSTVEVDKSRVAEYLDAGFEKVDVPERPKAPETKPTEPENPPKTAETKTAAPKTDEKKPSGRKVELKAVADVPETEPASDVPPATEPEAPTEQTGGEGSADGTEPATAPSGDETVPTPPAE